MYIIIFTFLTIVVSNLMGSAAIAQDDIDDGDDFDFQEEEPPLTVNGHLKLQTGVFVPLISDGFTPIENRAYGAETETGRPLCDPVLRPNRSCKPESHGKEAGSFSMGRATLQLEGDWNAHQDVVVHAIIRGVRAMQLEADEWSKPPILVLDTQNRREANKEWVRDNIYNEFEIRELYIDTYPFDWLSFRLGRQQITWGDIGQYRLLDVINPSDNTWHFGPLESFEDTRIPLWMAKGLIEIRAIDHSVELVWAPLFFDRPEDTVSRSLSFVGAWGLPYTNTPASEIRETIYQYPGGELKDMRGGLRVKGNLSDEFDYTLVYYYTHQLSPPVMYYHEVDPDTPVGIDRFYLEYPRQHIAGFSLEYAFETPISTVAKLEASVEPNRTYPMLSEAFSDHPTIEGRMVYDPREKVTLNYAVQLVRPTMLRFLNPTQNVLLVAQFMHSIIPNLSDEDKKLLTYIPGFNKWRLQEHEFTFSLVARTEYLNGLLLPQIMGVFIPPDNGFYSVSMGFRFGELWRAEIRATDFFGGDPYKSLGLFKDRDEVNLSVLCQF